MNRLPYSVSLSFLFFFLVSCAAGPATDSVLNQGPPGVVSYLTIYQPRLGERVETAYGHWVFELESRRNAQAPEVQEFLSRVPATSRKKLSESEFEELCRYLEEKGFSAMPSTSVEECIEAVQRRRSIKAIVLWRGGVSHAVTEHGIAGGGEAFSGSPLTAAERERIQTLLGQFNEMEQCILGLLAVKWEPETKVRISGRSASDLLSEFRDYLKQTRVRVVFEEVGRLEEAHPVRLGGSNVGMVDEIEPRDGDNVVTLLLDKDFKFYEDYEFRILKGEDGIPYVLMFPGTPSRAPVDSSRVLRGVD